MEYQFLFVSPSFKITTQSNSLKFQLFYITICVMKQKSRFFLVPLCCYWKFWQHSGMVMKTDCPKRADFICFMIFAVQTRTASTQANYVCPQNVPGQGKIKWEHDTGRYGNIKNIKECFHYYYCIARPLFYCACVPPLLKVDHRGSLARLLLTLYYYHFCREPSSAQDKDAAASQKSLK